MKPRLIVLLIGWCWTFIGCCSGAIGIYDMIKNFQHNSTSLQVFKFSTVFNILMICFDISIIVISQMFIRRSDWARIVLQLVSGVYLISSMLNFTTAIHRVINNSSIPKFVALFAAAGTITVSLVWLFVFAFCIWLLQTKKIKTEFNSM